MRLSKEQLEQFDREGYLFFPSLFTPQETATLNAAGALRNVRRRDSAFKNGESLLRSV